MRLKKSRYNRQTECFISLETGISDGSEPCDVVKSEVESPG